MNTDELTAAANRAVEEQGAATDELAALLAKIAGRFGSDGTLRIFADALVRMQEECGRSEVRYLMLEIPQDGRLSESAVKRLGEVWPQGSVILTGVEPEHRAPIMQYARGLRDADNEGTLDPSDSPPG